MTYSIGFGRYGPAEGVLTGFYGGGGAGGDPDGDPTPIFYGDLVIDSVTVAENIHVLDSVTGSSTALVKIVWTHPSVGFDEQLLNMVGEYLVSYRGGSTSFTPEASTREAEMTLTGLQVGLPIVIRVRAKTNAGALGPFHNIALITEYDRDAPPTPTTPSLYGTVRGVQAEWDGGFQDNAPRPPDFYYVRAEYSATVDFADVILGGQLTQAGTTAATLAFGTGKFRAYARFVAVDRSGNQSDPSPVVYIDSAQIVNADLTDDIIDSRLLGTFAVQQENVADFALTVRKLVSLRHQLY